MRWERKQDYLNDQTGVVSICQFVMWPGTGLISRAFELMISFMVVKYHVTVFSLILLQCSL